MLEFIFFDRAISDHFVAEMNRRGMKNELRDDHFGWVVSVDEEGLSDVLVLELEDIYEEFQEQERHRVESSEGGLEKHVAGFGVTLPDGSHTTVALAPDLASRLLAHFSLDEIHHMFSSVATAVIAPDDRPLCQREL